MRRSYAWLTVVLLGLALVGMATAPADAQTLMPPVLIGKDDKEKAASRDEEPHCAQPSLVCTGEAAVGAVGHAAEAGAGAATGAVMDGVVRWAAEGASWLVTEIGHQIGRSTKPALGSAWFGQRYAAMSELAIALSTIFLLLAAGAAIARQTLTLLLRAAFVVLPLAMVLTFAAVTLVEAGVALTDWLTASALSGFRSDTTEAFRDIGELLVAPTATGAALAPFVLFLGALVTAALALLVWVELVMREAAIYVAVAFLPLTLAAMIWERTAHWSRRLAEWLTAIILAKFTIAVAFALAASTLGQARSGSSGGLTALLAGCAVMLIAALTSWVLLRLLPFGEAGAGGLGRGQIGGAMQSAPGAMTATIAARQLMVRSFSSSGGGAMGGGGARASSGGSAAPASLGPASRASSGARGGGFGGGSESKPVATLPGTQGGGGRPEDAKASSASPGGDRGERRG